MLQYDHYKLLGISRDASPAQIKRAYRSRVKSCHPDVNPSPKASRVFRAVHEAYMILSDGRRRMRYDDELRFYRQAMNPQPEPPPRDARKYGHPRKRHEEMPLHVRPIDRYAFFGLHLTGLLFGMGLVSGILTGIVVDGWPVHTLLFGSLGIAVIPDSVRGLRLRAANDRQ
jgi:hypothetical protein